MRPVEHDPLMATAVRSSIRMVRGEGSWLFDDSGEAYLDLVQGRGTNSLGHASPVMAAALKAQAGRLVHAAPSFVPEAARPLASLLLQASGLHQAFFCNSGTEAVEAALKLARRWGIEHGKAHEIVTMADGFHGRTWGAMAANGRAADIDRFGPMVPGFRQARLNDIASVEAVAGPHTAAVLLELVQGEAGVICADAGFLRDLRALCDRRRILLVFDEVQTGMGRLGRLFGYQHFGVQPDIVCLGKGIAGGFPLAAVLACRDACLFRPGDHGGTFNGSALATSVGLAVTRCIGEPEFLEKVRATGAYFAAGLRSLAHDLRLAGAGGVGLLLRLDLGRPLAARAVAHAESQLRKHWRHGLLLNAPRPNLLRFLPALTVRRDEIDAALEGLRTVLHAVAREGPD